MLTWTMYYDYAYDISGTGVLEYQVVLVLRSTIVCIYAYNGEQIIETTSTWYR